MTSLFTFASLPSGADSWLQVLLDVAIKSLIILGLAKALLGLFKNRSAAARHLVWSVTVSALLVLPVLTLSLPAVGLPVLPTLIANTAAKAQVSEQSEPSADSPAPHQAAPDQTSGQSTNGVQAKENEASAWLSKQPDEAWRATLSPAPIIPEAHLINQSTAATAQQPFNWALIGLTVWLAGALIVAARFLVGFIRVWLIARHSKLVTDISWVTLVNGLSNRIGLRKKLQVLKSERVILPMTWGALRSVVLLPEDAEEWSLKCRSIVLLHELAHVKRHDCLTQTLAQLACALYWFNPLIWLAARSLRVERELACDDEVLQAGTRPSDYASYLVEIARSFGANVCVSPFAVGLACSELENRVRAILNPDVKRHTNNRLKVALSSLVAATFIIPLATVQPWVQASTLDEKLRRLPAAVMTEGEFDQERGLTESPTPNDREILRSLDAIKASLQTNEAATQHAEAKDQLHTDETAIAQQFLQPAVLIDGQNAGAGQGAGVGHGEGAGSASHQGLGAGVGSGQGAGVGSGLGAGVGSGQGDGKGQGAGFGAEGSGQGEKSSKDITADEVSKLKMYGVTPEFTEAVRKMGFENVTVDQLIQLKMYKVDDEYVKQVRSWGYDKVVIRDLISLKMAGVTGEYVLVMKNAGLEQPSVRQLVNMKMSRVTPEYIESLRRAGYDNLNLNQVMSLRHQNINEEFIKQAESWMGGKVTLNQLLQIKIHNVNPAFASEVKALGFDNVPFTKLLELRIHNVTSDYVREMRNLGFNNLTLDDLLRMRIHGVTAEYVKKMRAAGFINASLNQLIEMKMHGIDEILLKNSK